jgi:type III pantothenate kinase
VKLLIDLGNSRLKWGWASPRLVGEPGAVEHRGQSGATLAAALPDPPGPVQGIRIASVAAPSLTADLVAGLARRYGCVPSVAVPGTAVTGLRNGYREPLQLGVDRWLALRAAVAREPGSAACVVAAGTAFTLDLVMAEGRHLGGLIVPGLGLMRDALKSGTGNLARLAAVDPPGSTDESRLDKLVGRATGEAMIRGAQWALAALTLHHHQMLEESVPGARLVVTGGDAAGLLPLLPASAEHRPHLVLEGLALEPFDAGPASGGLAIG